VRNRAGLIGAAVVAFILVSGCATFGTYETAQTTPKGRLAFGGAITPLHVYGGGGEAGMLFFPLPELSGKLGVSDNFELGARWGFGPGMTFTGKYCFSRGSMDAAFATYGSLYGLAAGGAGFAIYNLTPRVILSSEAEGSFPFSVNAGLGFSGVFAGAENGTVSGSAFSAVGGFGLPFRVGGRRSTRIMPEFSISLPIISSFESDETSGSEALLGNFSVSVGVGFGSVPQAD